MSAHKLQAAVERVDLASLARLAFFLYFFLVFFGTDIPHSGRYDETGQMAASNVVNQVAFSSLYLLAFLSVANQLGRFLRFFLREKFLSLFLLWAFLSIFWSAFPLVSFKRWVQIFGAALIFTAFFLNTGSPKDGWKYLRAVAFAYVAVTIISILVWSEAWDPQFPGSWRGLAPQKNQLGQLMLISIVAAASGIKTGSGAGKWISAAFLAASVILLLGTRSMTAILVFLFLAGLAAVFYLGKLLGSQSIARFLAGSFLIIGAVSLAMAQWIDSDFLARIFELLGKDTTFSSRTLLWQSMLARIAGHPVLGCGYGAFWVEGSRTLLFMHEEFIWRPIQAHNGYLDILNETGAVGLFLVVVVIGAYFIRVRKTNEASFYLWLVLASLINNIQESSLFRLNEAMGVVFTLGYLALFAAQQQELRSGAAATSAGPPIPKRDATRWGENSISDKIDGRQSPPSD